MNETLNSEPGLLNRDPEGDGKFPSTPLSPSPFSSLVSVWLFFLTINCGIGWLCKIQASKPEELDTLLDDKAYKEVCEEDH